MPKTVVGIGCSHTVGCMMDGKSGDTPYIRARSFTAQIAKHLGYSHINLGMNGGSNQYIFRIATKFIADHIENIQDYYFILGWTGASRMELRYPDDTPFEYLSGDRNLTDQKYIPYSLGSTESLHGMFKSLQKFAPYILNHTMLYDHWASYAYNLQTLFKSLNIKYLMCNTVEHLNTTANNSKVIDLLDTDYYYKPTDPEAYFVEFAINKYKKTPCWHFPMPAHAHWAKTLITEMKL